MTKRKKSMTDCENSAAWKVLDVQAVPSEYSLNVVPMDEALMPYPSSSPVILTDAQGEHLKGMCQRYQQVADELGGHYTQKKELAALIKDLECEQIYLGQQMTDLVLGKANPGQLTFEEALDDDPLDDDETE